MEKAFRDMIEWETACGRTLSDGPPSFPGEKKAQLCLRLIGEEMHETLNAIDAATEAASDGHVDNEKLALIADGIIDSIYVLLDAAFEFGIDPVAAWDEVHRANMRKHGPGSWRDETGKVRKPPGWAPPDVKGILERQWSLAEIYGGGES